MTECKCSDQQLSSTYYYTECAIYVEVRGICVCTLCMPSFFQSSGTDVKLREKDAVLCYWSAPPLSVYSLYSPTMHALTCTTKLYICILNVAMCHCDVNAIGMSHLLIVRIHAPWPHHTSWSWLITANLVPSCPAPLTKEGLRDYSTLVHLESGLGDWWVTTTLLHPSSQRVSHLNQSPPPVPL